MSAITFSASGDTIVGNLYTASSQKPLAFLCLQGWRGTQNTHMTEKLAELGYTSMTYDMRGNNDSEGDTNQLRAADYLGDAVIAYDYLKAQVAPNTTIGVIGNSFGSYIATLLSVERPVYCLSLKVPANYPDERFDSTIPPQVDTDRLARWRKQKRPYFQNKATTALHDFTGPIQIIEAEKDEAVPHQNVLNYIDAIRDKSKLDYTLMAGAPHGLISDTLRDYYEHLLFKWTTALL